MKSPICVECRDAVAMEHGSMCRDCLADYLRRTRKVSPWVQRMIERRGVAKVMS